MRVLLIFLILMPLFANADVKRILNDPCFMMEQSKGPCSYVVNGEVYLIHTNGTIELRMDDESSALTIDLPRNFEIENIKHATIGGDIIFNFSITDYESGSTIIARFSQEKTDISWQSILYAFNSSPLLVEGNSIYVGSIGLVSKIDALSGDIIWSHSGLYENDTQAYNSFVKPIKDGKLVVFEESKVSFVKYKGVRKVIVNDTTGELISK